MTPTIQLVEGLSRLADNYDAAICDIWGVIHNGRKAYERACEALIAFRKTRGPVLLLSNAPRPGADVMRHLDGFGVPREAYDAVLTSGDGTRAELMRRAKEQGTLQLYHIGPARDRPLVEGLDINNVPLAQANLILCSGPFDDEIEKPDDYRDTYKRGVESGLTMLCANPDLMVERGPKLIYCAGALAAAYEAAGGSVVYFGKPHRPVYEQALVKLNELKGSPLVRTRILAIGDGLRTDVKGANLFGIDVLLVTAGLHVAEFGSNPFEPSPFQIAKVLVAQQLSAVAALPHLAW